MLCPICQSPVPGSAEGQKSAYPFCSDRCRLIDLGRWLGGKYRIPMTREESEGQDRTTGALPDAGLDEFADR